MSKPHALIIDDIYANIEVLGLLLAKEGCSYSFLHRPHNLKEFINDIERLDVIFLDLEIPNSNYHKLVKMLKAEPRIQGVPIVAYTVHVSEMMSAKKAGFDGFLGKPLYGYEFPDHLRRILAGENVWIA